jgi:hypothetical protein
MDDYFTLRGLLLKFETKRSTVGLHNKLCLACFEKYREGRVTATEECWDDLIDDMNIKCSNDRMCRPLLMIRVRDCLATETDASLFTYRCDLRSKEYDKINVNVLKYLATIHSQRIVEHMISRLNRVLGYRNARKSLGAFFDLVHGTTSHTKKKFIGQILDMSFNGATADTDLADIVNAVESGVLLFMDASLGFVIKSLDELNALTTVQNQTKVHQIAYRFSDHSVIVMHQTPKVNSKHLTLEIDPSPQVTDEIMRGTISYGDNNVVLSCETDLVLHYLDSEAIYHHLFNTVYRNGKECLDGVIPEVTDIRLISRWSLPNFKPNASKIESGNDALKSQFKFMVTSHAAQTYINEASIRNIRSGEYIEDAALDLFLVYLQAISPCDYSIDYSFLSTIRFIDPFNVGVNISCTYVQGNAMYMIEKVKKPRQLCIAFDSRFVAHDPDFRVDDWYKEKLKTLCGSESELFKKYTEQMLNVIVKLQFNGVVKSELLFNRLTVTNRRQMVRIKNTLEGFAVVMFYSNALSNCHHKYFYRFSMVYNRNNLDRCTTTQVRESDIKRLPGLLTDDTHKQIIDSDEIKKNTIEIFVNGSDKQHLLLHIKNKNIVFYCKGKGHLDKDLIDLATIMKRLK